MGAVLLVVYLRHLSDQSLRHCPVLLATWHPPALSPCGNGDDDCDCSSDHRLRHPLRDNCCLRSDRCYPYNDPPFQNSPDHYVALGAGDRALCSGAIAPFSARSVLACQPLSPLERGRHFDHCTSLDRSRFAAVSLLLCTIDCKQLGTVECAWHCAAPAISGVGSGERHLCACCWRAAGIQYGLCLLASLSH